MPLIYVDLFDWVAKDDDLDMWIVQQHMVSAPGGLQRAGAIVPLVNVMFAVELIPVYGEKIDCTVNEKTSQEVYSRFYLNSFADKELFESLRAEL